VQNTSHHFKDKAIASMSDAQVSKRARVGESSTLLLIGNLPLLQILMYCAANSSERRDTQSLALSCRRLAQLLPAFYIALIEGEVDADKLLEYRARTTASQRERVGRQLFLSDHPVGGRGRPSCAPVAARVELFWWNGDSTTSERVPLSPKPDDAIAIEAAPRDSKVHGRGYVLQSMLDEVVASMTVDDAEEADDDDDRETWSLAFQLRVAQFVPYDVQLHLPASLCTSTLWTFQSSKDVFRTLVRETESATDDEFVALPDGLGKRFEAKCATIEFTRRADEANALCFGVDDFDSYGVMCATKQLRSYLGKYGDGNERDDEDDEDGDDEDDEPAYIDGADLCDAFHDENLALLSLGAHDWCRYYKNVVVYVPLTDPRAPIFCAYMDA
jgi:hypothetical protein